MVTLNFSTHINAKPDKVWKILWDDATYRQWTSAFSEGSYAESDWKQGSRIHFLSPGGDGMYSEIDRLTPNELMSFKHLGVMKGGKELPNDDETKAWAGSHEIYTLKEQDGGTELLVELESTESFNDYFSKTFPEALKRVKQLAEN